MFKMILHGYIVTTQQGVFSANKHDTDERRYAQIKPFLTTEAQRKNKKTFFVTSW